MSSIFLGKGNLGKFGGDGLPLDEFSESLKKVAEKEQGPSVFIFHECSREIKDQIVELLGCTEHSYIEESPDSGILVCGKQLDGFNVRGIDLPTDEPGRLIQGFERKGAVIEVIIGDISIAIGTLLANPYMGDSWKKRFLDGSRMRSDQRKMLIKEVLATEAKNKIIFGDFNPFGSTYKAALKSLLSDPYSIEYKNMIKHLNNAKFICPLDKDILPPTYQKGRISFHERNLFIAGEIVEFFRNKVIYKDSVFSKIGDRPILESVRIFLERKEPTLPE